METQTKIVQLVFDAVDEVNSTLPPEKQIPRSIDAVLYGQLGKLDSLGLISLVMAAESRVERQFGVAVTLINEDALSEESSPFRTIGTLAEYIEGLMKDPLSA